MPFPFFFLLTERAFREPLYRVLIIYHYQISFGILSPLFSNLLLGIPWTANYSNDLNFSTCGLISFGVRLVCELESSVNDGVANCL